MSRRIAELLNERTATTLTGRSSELEALLATLDDGGVPFTHVHGIGGIGKTALLAAFSAQARRLGAIVINLDGRVVEPTASGFLHEVGAATGHDTLTAESIAEHLGGLGERVVLVLDTFELLRLIDTWLRQEFAPLLPENVRLIIASREPPSAGWIATPGWQHLSQRIALGPLEEDNAIELLVRAGVDRNEATRINRFASGHPLALQLAAAAFSAGDDLLPEDRAIPQVVAELTRVYLRDVDDTRTRRALEAASVVRRTTVPLLRAMIPGDAPQDTFDRLRELPFVELRRDGLHLHDSIQQALATELKAVDPTRYQTYRRRAWECLQTEARQIGRSELWRYTADMLYLVENPVVREAFFPSTSSSITFEPARPSDADAIEEIICTTEGPESAGHLLRLWREAPHVFTVGRDRERNVSGFYCMFQPEAISPVLIQADPIMQRWLAHLEAEPLRGQVALFARRWLARGRGESPSPTQAMAWLDMKREYMELRPRLGRVYMTVWDLETYANAATSLRFELMPDATVELDGRAYYLAVNNFGPASVDGWLARLVGDELGIAAEPELLDIAGRELVANGSRIPLTHLEFEVLRYLYEREGEAVSRDELLDNVWGESYAGGSNVVDVVVLALRKKIGERAALLQTVRGTGYRFRQS